ncbi:MAG: TetR/AcrR family transcriptional regulator [Cellulomonadaceae bacterium]
MPTAPRRPKGGPLIGRPPKITRDDVLTAVLDIGFADVTVPLVAERLDVTPATVYRHVPDRATMLSLAWDRVVDDIPWPTVAGDWRAVLLAYAECLWDALAEHPGVVTALSSGLMPERTMDILLALAAHLEREGFAMPDAMLVIDTVIDTVIDHRLGLEKLDGHTPDPGVSRAEMASSWEPHDDDPAALQRARAAMRDAVVMPPRQWLNRKLSLILDGGEKLREHH